MLLFNLGAPSLIRTEKTSPFERDDFTYLSKGACWSEYKDSNLGPPGPKPGALPGCATLRITGATGRNRTGTPLKTTDFKSVAATDYATVAENLVPQRRLELLKFGF